ncbi:hypothetical protein BMF94_3151 [Rhodotorula taiwanensis]|uniref:Uncharacterized protein n=1 Tax=Rhodotorula taiwanensis TaxID=741276 RepID=A0A2S5BA23_9BASI|nr:hypothetical protein BMF94_3151 [Rhodotorula taiwanensis]
MSNSDKFQQDDAIVDAEPEVQGVLAGEGSDDVGTIGKDEFKNDEFDGVSEENIIEGERSNRASGFAEAEQKADDMVEQAVNANDGTSRVA